MNQRKSKLFRDLFDNKRAYRTFKKAYTEAPLKKRLDTIEMANRIRLHGPIKHVKVKDVG